MTNIGSIEKQNVKTFSMFWIIVNGSSKEREFIKLCELTSQYLQRKKKQ